MRLSICMMVKNEENNLERCLISLRPLMNAVESELIIVDTGSDDNTVEIAKKYTDKVYFHPWNNDFSAMRNITLSYAKGEWVLIIDADEEIEDCEAIIDFLNSNKRNDFSAGIVTIKSLLHENLRTENSYTIASTVRLFKNNKSIQFEGSIHEATYYGENKIFLKTTFNHYGYIADDKVLTEKKFKRNISLLLLELEKDADNIKYRNYICAQYLDHEDYKEALFHILKAYEIIKCKKLNLKDHLFIYSNLAMSLFKNNKFEKAKKICIEGLEQNDEHLDLHFILANIAMNDKNYDSAIEHYHKYLSLIDNFENLSIRTNLVRIFITINRHDEVYLNLATIYIEQKKYDLALEYIRKVTNEDLLEYIFAIYIKLFIQSRQFDKLKNYYENTVLLKSEKVIDIFLLAVETYRNKLNSEEWINLLKEFSVGESPYSKYCEIRIAYIEKRQDANSLINTFISSFNINKTLYADILYYLIDLKIDAERYIVKVSDNTISDCITILSKRFDNFSEKVQESLDNYNSNASFEIAKLNKYLYLYILNLDILPNDKFHSALLQCIHINLVYMNKIYNKVVFENEMVYDVKDEYEAFIIYINKALNLEKENESEYFKYMRKALNICPAMNKGIKLLLNEHESNLKNTKISTEFEELKIEMKKIINKLIDSNQIDQALSTIEQYKSIVKNDAEINKLELKISTLQTS